MESHLLKLLKLMKQVFRSVSWNIPFVEPWKNLCFVKTLRDIFKDLFFYYYLTLQSMEY